MSESHKTLQAGDSITVAAVPLAAEEAELLRHRRALGPRGRSILMALAARLHKGAEIGDFEPKGRKGWDAETREELLDAMVYQTAALLESPEPEAPLWAPKAGDWVRVTGNVSGAGKADFPVGRVFQVGRVAPSGMSMSTPAGAWLAFAATATPTDGVYCDLARICDAQGFAPDGKPWIPPVGAEVRVVWTQNREAPPAAGTVLTVTGSRSYTAAGAAVNGWHCRVVPVER